MPTPMAFIHWKWSYKVRSSAKTEFRKKIAAIAEKKDSIAIRQAPFRSQSLYLKELFFGTGRKIYETSNYL